MTTFTDEQKRQTQGNLQAVLRDMQQGRVPPTPRLDPAREAFLDRETIAMPAMPRTDKLPVFHRKTPFEAWLDAHIFAFWEKEHKFPHSIHISSIRKLEYIVEQLEEREDAPIRWHEYTFRHTNGWISIQLEAKIMGYSEVNFSMSEDRSLPISS